MKIFLYSFSTMLCLAGLVMPSQAQNDKFGIRLENRGTARLNKPSPELPNAEVAMVSMGINGAWRKKIDKQKLGLTTLTLGAEYRFTQLEYTNVAVPSGNTLPTQLHALRLQLDYMTVIKQKWILSVLLRPGIFTDFENTDWGHARLEGLALMDYRPNPKNFYGFGVGRSAGFGRVLILPVLHYMYRSPSFVADILLPSRADIGWIRKKWYYGFNAAITGNQFQLGNIQNGFAGSNRIGVSDLTLGPVLRYHVREKNYFVLEGGATGTRRWEFRNDDRAGDARFIQEFDPKPTWYLRGGFVMRY